MCSWIQGDSLSLSIDEFHAPHDFGWLTPIFLICSDLSNFFIISSKRTPPSAGERSSSSANTQHPLLIFEVIDLGKWATCHFFVVGLLLANACDPLSLPLKSIGTYNCLSCFDHEHCGKFTFLDLLAHTDFCSSMCSIFLSLCPSEWLGQFYEPYWNFSPFL